MKLQKELLNQMADQHKLLFWISCFCVAMSKCLTRTSVRWFDFAEFCGGIQSTEVWGVYHHNRGSWLRYACSQERTADRQRDRARKLPIPHQVAYSFWVALSSKDSRTFYCKTNTQEPRSNTLVFGVMSHSEHSTDQQALFILY